MPIPEHAESCADGGYICRHCGGAVDEDGSSLALMSAADEDEEGGGSPPSEEDFWDAVARKGDE